MVLQLHVTSGCWLAHRLPYLLAGSERIRRKEMNRSSDTYTRRALEIAEALMSTANEGEAASNDDGCRILFGVCRDCAYKIRRQAERLSSHTNLPRTGQCGNYGQWGC